MNKLLAVTSLAVLLAAGCSGGSSPAAAPSPSPTASATPSATPTAAPTATATPSASSVPGPVWPVDARSLPVTAQTHGVSVLRAMRVGQHAGYERITFEFSQLFGAVHVRFVPVVRADPSDKVLPLKGVAYLNVVVEGGVAKYSATQITPYSGPSAVTPGGSTVQEVAITGDFESVLSFGVGLSRTAGFQLQRLASPPRLIVDVAERPVWRNWPDQSLAAARTAQAAWQAGHQPWRSVRREVVLAYARAVLLWSDPVATDLGGGRFRIAMSHSPDTLVVTTTRPLGTGVVEVSNTR